MRSRAARIYDEVGEPPAQLESKEVIGNVVRAQGNSLYEIKVSQEDVKSHKLGSASILAVMPKKFRNTVFVKRGGYVVIGLFGDTQDTDDKVKGEISNIVINKKDWQKYPYWPEEFKDVVTIDLPPESDEEDEYEYEEEELEEDNQQQDQ